VLEQTREPRQVAFVQDVGLARDLKPGPISTTGNLLDLAIDGEGYLTFQTPEGDRYGRAGHLAIDSTGQIVDSKGNPLLDEAGAPLIVPPGETNLTIAGDGTIASSAGPLGRLQLVTFGNEQALRREGDGLYSSEAVPRPAAGRVVQGALEGSNVAPVLEMTEMLSTVRAFEGVQRLIEAQQELDRRAIERMISTQA
jgi:flagellar basal-body rod protein FlgF